MNYKLKLEAAPQSQCIPSVQVGLDWLCDIHGEPCADTPSSVLFCKPSVRLELITYHMLYYTVLQNYNDHFVA